tara:strand:+ start:981 stop:1136 length:156 start_codon:yes stop_codon:yes gene_type:complete
MVRKRNPNWVDTKELEDIFAKILKKKEVDEETLKLKDEFIEGFKRLIRKNV